MADTLEQTVEQLVRQVAGRYFGKYRGSVTDVRDPDGSGRIMALVPAVMGEVEVGWALPAFAFAGDGHGQVMLPEVGSMVWIEFEAGNLDFPIWSGGFFLPGQRPGPDSAGARVIVSRENHRIVLDDDADTVTIAHGGGATIEMTATAITLSIGASKMVLGMSSIAFNDRVVKIGRSGVSLAGGAMTLGTPP